MLTLTVLLASVAVVPSALPSTGETRRGFSTEPQRRLDPDERSWHLLPPIPRERSKKEAWLADKAGRPDVRVTDAKIRRRAAPRPSRWTPVATGAPGTTTAPVTTLFNLRTKEALPLLPGLPVDDLFHPFLRDHFTNEVTLMDVELIDVLARVAQRFRAERIEVVSGYRSPKYNLMLRKKGREVARTSQHTQGNAVDFRIRGVPTATLLRFMRSLRRGGVGFYPRSQFVHTDTGRVRFWRGS